MVVVVVVALNPCWSENALSEYALPCSICRLYTPIGTGTVPPYTVGCSASGLSTQTSMVVNGGRGTAGQAVAAHHLGSLKL